MPLPRFEKLEPERRAAIFDTAARHFAADGYDGASVNGILADCGVSKGAAYYWFHDKADLFASTVEYAVDRTFDRVRIDADGLDAARFWPALRELYLHQVAFLRDRPDLWRVTKVAFAAAGHPTDGPRIAERLAPLAADLQRLLARGLEIGALRRDLPVDLLLAMVGGLDDAVDQYLLAHPDAAGDTGLLDTVFAALRTLAAPEEAR